MSPSLVGQPVVRIDAVEKIRGAAIYVADLKLPRMLFARTLRSPHPHARIRAINVEAALKLPGVAAVVTGQDLNALGGEAVRDMPFLARERVRYVGEPVAAVAAEEESIAEAAIQLIEVSYEELPAVFDPVLAAQPGAPLLHEQLEAYEHIGVVQPIAHSNIISVSEEIFGDVAQGFAASDHVWEDTFRMHTVQHGQIEPHCALAQWGVDGKIVVWTPNDGPHRLRKELADALAVPLTRIQVNVPYLGGGFGGKGGLKAEAVTIALAKKVSPRPVKLIMTREEVFSATLVRHAAVVTVKTGVKADGTLVAREVTAHWDTGAYAEKGPTVVKQAMCAAAGPYRIPHVRLVGYCVYTNKVTAGAYRGYGTPQVTWAYESQTDMIGRRLGIDPLDFRLKNLLREGDTMPTGQRAQAIGLEECLKRVAAELRWHERPRPGRGKGLACTYKNTKTPSGSAAHLTLNQDGTVNVLSSTVEIGQGAKTILAQIVADELGIPVRKIVISFPDTDTTPFDASTTSSRSTFHMGNAVRIAADDIKAQLRELGSRLWHCPAQQIEVGDGQAKVRGQEKAAASYEALVKKFYGAGGSILGRGFYYPEATEGGGMWSAPSVFWMYGVQGAEVEVDRDTGQVKILKLVAAHDVGRAINPVTCSGQIEGGAVHGASSTVAEEVLMENGRILNANLHDYKMFTALDAPEVVPIIVEAPHQEGPYGAKGIGEPVLSPTAPAIANAVEDAVGARIQELPLTCEKVLRALGPFSPGRERGG
jgi:carbon-monoxide dehydrogenase large subunit